MSKPQFFEISYKATNGAEGRRGGIVDIRYSDIMNKFGAPMYRNSMKGVGWGHHLLISDTRRGQRISKWGGGEISNFVVFKKILRN